MSHGSLQQGLRRRVALAVLAVLLPLGLLAALRTISELNALSDVRLRQTAETLDALLRQTGVMAVQNHARLEALPSVPVIANGVGPASTYEAEVGYRVTDKEGDPILVTDNMRELPRDLPADGQVVSLEIRRRRWHVYTRMDPTLGVTISVAERHDTRRDVTNAVAMERTLPILIGLPLLFIALRWAVRKGLRPLDTLAALLARRKPGAREPVVVADTPREMAPIVEALNTQIDSIETALERERRFSADVAHELRTPIAATMINLDSAVAFGTTATSAELLPDALASLRILSRRTEQLLVLAHLDEHARLPLERVDLKGLASDVLAEWAPTVDCTRFLLTVHMPEEAVTVPGYPEALAAMLRNLLENAARHAPLGGRVMLALAASDGTATMDVVDDGPGIPPDRRDAVFQRFHREATGLGDGFGVGLSIVQRVAQLHGATVSLGDAPWGHGLKVRVSIPLAVPVVQGA
ncbi:sensor histidine kinase [Luteibacter aegosomatissinici]|uniref:sensor histidine kinase n=1 Tax=Luteibacter aegosomatissinici TaxID=2911539 RepID=UPI001FF8ED57|nr:ATP-binding protein [Luteibacter aegosomatissinici]UPG96037.1 ATP-binding protein [Luteibacter aegosomatissinici]